MENQETVNIYDKKLKKFLKFTSELVNPSWPGPLRFKNQPKKQKAYVCFLVIKYLVMKAFPYISSLSMLPIIIVYTMENFDDMKKGKVIENLNIMGKLNLLSFEKFLEHNFQIQSSSC